MNKSQIESFLDAISEIAPELLTTAKWLLETEDRDPQAPDDDQLEQLFDVLQQLRMPWQMQLGEQAIIATPRGTRIVARKQLAQLLASKHWRYPFRVLQHPLLDEMLEICDQRLAEADGEPPQKLTTLRTALASAIAGRERAEGRLYKASLRRGSGLRHLPPPDDE